MAFCTKCGAQNSGDSKFCPKCGTPIQSSNDDIPSFTPPTDGVPTFTPPAHTSRQFDGPVCFHHPNEPAAGQCVRCGKYVCKDCVEAYTVTSGDYANQCLCYDCCQALVSENVTELKKKKIKITALFIATIIGMVIGALFFTVNPIAGIICMFWFGSFWWWIKNTVNTLRENPDTRSFWGFIGAGLGGLLFAPIQTITKIVQCISFLSKAPKYIKEDSDALVEMKEYMEYTQVISRNKGVDLETLMNEGSDLYNNSYAQKVSSQGEASADAALRQYTTRIAENGEIIRGFSI